MQSTYFSFYLISDDSMSFETNNTIDDIKKSSVAQTVTVDSLTILIIMLTLSFLIGFLGIGK